MKSNSDPLEALMRRVNVQDDGCWVREGAAVRGYPVLKLHGRQVRAARLAYDLFVGPLDDALTIDHLCRNTRCVNPVHLEAVPIAENLRRQAAAVTHCPQGHEYTEANTYRHGNRRSCRACWAARNARQVEYRREWKRRKRAQALG